MNDHIEKIQKYLHNGCAEDMENRIEILRNYIDEILLNIADPQDRRCGYLHLYGVSQACAMIALRRNENVELATMAGMLHDLNSYKAMNTENHAELGAVLARQILNEMSLTTDDETELICSAIRNHSSKSAIHSAFDEVLKDADVLQHYLYNPLFPVMEHEKFRLHNLFTEFGIMRTSMDFVMIKKQINRLIELLMCPEVDVDWSSYDNPEQVINELKSIENGLLNGDIKSIDKMKFLLAPTGDLQEISISSGWGDEFLEIVYAIEIALGIQRD